jgi:large subunit ribosomal protein L23
MGFFDKTLKRLKTKSSDKEKESEREVSKVKIESKDSEEKGKFRTEEKPQKIKDEIKVESKKETKKEEKKREVKEDTKNAYKILIKPLVSEKAAEAGKLNQYIFIVNIGANKQEIKKAINVVYGIKPIKVNVINMRGKTVRFGRTYGKRKNFKKAIVTLPKGKSIQIYEGT